MNRQKKSSRQQTADSRQQTAEVCGWSAEGEEREKESDERRRGCGAVEDAAGGCGGVCGGVCRVCWWWTVLCFCPAACCTSVFPSSSSPHSVLHPLLFIGTPLHSTPPTLLLHHHPLLHCCTAVSQSVSQSPGLSSGQSEHTGSLSWTAHPLRCPIRATIHPLELPFFLYLST